MTGRWEFQEVVSNRNNVEKYKLSRESNRLISQLNVLTESIEQSLFVWKTQMWNLSIQKHIRVEWKIARDRPYD